MGRRILLDYGKWNLIRGGGAFIFTSDEEVLAVTKDPYGYKQKSFQKSFVEVCQEIKKSGGKIIGVSYDFFFGGKERKFYPNSPEYIEACRLLYNISQQYGLLFTASIISPLDLGPPYVKIYSDIGYWYQYREVKPDKEGLFDVILPLQKVWFHNKGPCFLTLEKVVCYRYKEYELNSEYFYVPQDSISLLEDQVLWEILSDSEITYPSGYSRANIRVKGKVSSFEPNDSILILLVYKTEEMDYFSSQSEIFIEEVIDSYKNAGIVLSGFYSDEMHIQFDWDLSNHFGKREIQARYITPNLIRVFSDTYGEEYEDFVKYLVYFAHHLGDDFSNWPIQHILEPDENGIYKTWLLRKNYFTLLNKRVTELYVKALNYAEKVFNTTQYTQAHATWQESPTCDQYDEDYSFGKSLRENVSRYDYGPHYVASSSVREGVSACYDYFKWGEFLTGEGNDFPEGGNIDRNYYGMAMSASFANINKFPVTYCGSWGSPKEAIERFNNVASAYGVINSLNNIVRYVQGFGVRTVPVLTIYPLDLLYANDRFGSWMVQYGYTDYITEEMLLKYGFLSSRGTIKVYDKEYSTILFLFQPFIKEETLGLLEEFIYRGGILLWTSIPAMSTYNGTGIFSRWCKLFGISEKSPIISENYPKGEIIFIKEFVGIESMEIPTDLFPDKVYSMTPSEASPVALLNGKCVGFIKESGKGKAIYMGFRVRDNQSEKMFTLFNILYRLGSYPEYSPEYLAHTTPYFFSQFPNGAVSVARHYYELEEDWEGSFFRKEDKPRNYPTTRIDLSHQKILDHTINYKGDKVMAYRLDKDSKLIGFAGYSTVGLEIDGVHYKFIDKPGDILFASIDKDRLIPDMLNCWIIYSSVEGRFEFPFELKGVTKAVILDETQTYITEEMPIDSTNYIIIPDKWKEQLIYLISEV